MNRLGLAAAPILLMAACAGFPFFQRAESHVDEAGQGRGDEGALVTVELQEIRFDGETVSGRLLIGVDEGRLRLDERIIESIHLTTESVAECSTGRPLPHIVMDVLAPPPRKEDILELAPGYWYGKEVRLPLLESRLAPEKAPECIDAEFQFRAMGGRPTGRLRVRAIRAAPPAGDAGLPMDAGIQP